MVFSAVNVPPERYAFVMILFAASTVTSCSLTVMEDVFALVGIIRKMTAPIRKGMKIRNQSLRFLLGVSSSEDSSDASFVSVVLAETAESFFFSPMLICFGVSFFFERRISMKMQTASTSAQTMTTGIQILLITLANPLDFEEREGNGPLPFWKFEGSKLPSPGVKEPEGFFESESESESEELLSGLDGLSESELESESEDPPGLLNPEFEGSKPSGMFSGSKFSGSKSPLKPPGKLPEPPPGKPEESDELKPEGMLPRPDLDELCGSANLNMIVAIMRSVKTARTIV